jgi:hypothetical protein
MGYRSQYYAGFYIWIGIVSVVCMCVGYDILFKGGQDCEYTCPLMTLDSAAVNAKLAEQGFTSISYDTSSAVLSYAACTVDKGYCLMFDDGSGTYSNSCVPRDTILAMTTQEAYSRRCMYCDDSGTVFWPSQKVSGTTNWIPTSNCGSAYSNAGLESAGTPLSSTIVYDDGSTTATIDFTDMGNAHFTGFSQDLTQYPYCEGTDSMGWQTSAIDLKASTTVTMLLLLCVYYTIMAFCCLCVGLTFYHFSKYEKDDWQKLKSCENCFACLAKQMQIVLRIANTVSVIFVVILFVNIWVDGVCTNASNEFGQKQFYPAIQGYTMFVLVTFCLHCVGGCYFRSTVGMETAFFTPKHVFHAKEKMGCGDYVRKYWICLCKYYNIWGGP